MKIPKGVEMRIESGIVYVRGAQGQQKARVEGVRVEAGEIRVENEKGREVIKRMLQGVSTGYKGKLKINGVGYRAQQEGGKIKLSLGYKDEKEVNIEGGVEIKITENGTKITGRSANYEKLRSQLSRIEEQRAARKDRYKGKGIG